MYFIWSAFMFVMGIFLMTRGEIHEGIFAMLISSIFAISDTIHSTYATFLETFKTALNKIGDGFDKLGKDLKANSEKDK